MRVCGCVCVSARTRERGRARERERESEEAVCVGWVVCIVWSEAGRRDTERRVKRAVWRGVRSSGGAWSEMCGRGVRARRVGGGRVRTSERERAREGGRESEEAVCGVCVV